MAACRLIRLAQRSLFASRAPVGRLAVLLLALLALAPQAGHAPSARAASLTFTVTTTVDAPDAHPGDGLCADSTGQCTVRAAVEEADAQPAGCTITIVVPRGFYALPRGPLTLSSTTVRLQGTGRTTLWGGGHRVLQVGPTAQVQLVQLTIAGGQAPVGGGIANAGTLLLWQSTVISNTARQGGGIANGPGAQLQLVRSTLVSNTATISPSAPAGCPGSVLSGTAGNGGNGGALVNCGVVQLIASSVSDNTAVMGGGIANAGMLTVSGSSLSGNTAQVGGAIASTGTLTLLHSAMTANTATFYSCCTSHYGGGGLYTSGAATMTGSTISGNTAPSGGGINNFGTLTVRGSTISGNTTTGPGGSGGGINNSGTVSGSSTVSGNSATFGGGINNNGTLTMTRSTITANTATDYGGGIENNTSLTLTNSAITGNTGTFGGGINNDDYATLAVTSSTFSGNMTSFGGAIYNNLHGSVRLTYVTIAGNQTGVYTQACCPAAPIALTGTIIADSTNGPNCTGPITEQQGYNLDSDGSCGLNQPTDLSNTNPLLGPLQNNGGPTQTMALLPGSPAIDHGGTASSGCPATDQRGLPRPDEAADNGACDNGAYESQGLG